uniref:Dipeptidyl-peptidase 10 (inactive) n=1 Tax=Takifugu rubripes TaxID=31033 RepID=A0A674N1V7_TAKRU
DGDILKVNTRNQTELLMKNTTFATFKASKFAVSPDLNFVLLAYDIKQVYQHSFLASYLIYNLYTREVKELNPPEVSDSVLQFASWGGHGQQMIYIFENNIYFQSDVQSSSWRLTSSGQEGIIFNGIADWLYEEEILHTHVAHWWSADGSRLAYLTINDSLVPNMLLPRFTGMLYPRGKEYPYPKMAQINPTVRLYVVTLDGTSQTTELRPPDSFEKSEYYITMVKWVGPESLSVRWVNRAQNMSILSLCSVVTGICTSKKVMTSEKWLDRQNEEPLYSRDHMTFFITVPLKHSDSGTFSHITMISNRGNIRHLTSGSWEVSQLLAYDESINSVYFLSTEESLLFNKCLSCSLFRSKCSFYDSTFSPDLQHVVLHCKGNISSQPFEQYHQTLERSSMLRQFCILVISMFLNIKKSLIVTVFIKRVFSSGSNSDSALGGQAVSDRFSLGWDTVLVSLHSVIVARLDGRGSGFQGQRILHEVHQRLGTVDVKDQLAALQYLLQLPYVDHNRIGVYGKAYGGFVSSLLLLSHSSMFRCGIAVAPITNWKLYGSAQSEKYFGYPGKEDHKYQISTLLHNIAQSPLNFLIIHNTADGESKHITEEAALRASEGGL